jgi:thioredoxin-related protein
MTILWTTLLSFFLLSSATWETDFEKAKGEAKDEHKHILLNFSGSDWCGPCIRMHKEIFESAPFTEYSNEHLVLLNADFPRLKKHSLSSDQQKKNDQLADTYNKEGKFPLTLLLTADGKILKTWDGLPAASAAEFTGQVKAAIDADN